MNVINESTSEKSTPTPPAQNNAAPKPKRVRRPNQRRPKVFPAPLRQKLMTLGHQPQGNDTSDANLSFLIERLSADLQGYQVEAQHWQNKYLELKKEAEANGGTLDLEGASSSVGDEEEARRRRKDALRAERAGGGIGGASSSALGFDQASTSATGSISIVGSGSGRASTSTAAVDVSSLFLPSTSATVDLRALAQRGRTSSSGMASGTSPNGSPNHISTFEYELLHKLQATANPTLALHTLQPPNLRSTVNKSHRLLVGASGEHAFDRVLTAVSSLANLFGMYSPAGSHRWAGITKLKPDFSEEKARTLWNDIFAPINVTPSRLIFDSAPSSRQHIAYDLDDPDVDHMDRILAVATDLEVVDMLHYCSLLITGMHQAAFENGELSDARDHLGRNCERLMREAVFTRNIGSNPNLAQGLLAGIVGMLRHFSTQNRSGAVISILEIAWQMSVQHVAMVHPIMKGLVTFLSTVLAPSPSRRAVWMARNQENFQSTSERYFHLTTTAYFTASYYALWMRDEDALLHYVAQLDEILAPCASHEEIINGPRYSDPGSGCLIMEAWKEEPDFVLQPETASPPPVPQNATGWLRPPTDVWVTAEAPPSHNQHLQQPHPSSTHNSSSSYLSASSSSSSSSPSHSQVPPTNAYQHVYYPSYPAVNIETSPENHGPYLSTKPTSPSSSDSTYQYPHPFGTTGTEDSSAVSSAAEDGNYIPDENFKTLLRVAVHLIRAEACLFNADYPMCRHWVDEAERTLKTIPLMFLSQRIFLVDVSTLKNIFTTTCPFPSGTRSVAEEFERRMLQNDKEKLAHPDILRSTVGTTVYEGPSGNTNTHVYRQNYTQPSSGVTASNLTASWRSPDTAWSPDVTRYPPAASHQF